jgi:serine protease Do
MLRFLLLLIFPTLLAASDRLVVDDTAYVEKCTAGAAALHQADKLVPFSQLRTQLDRKTCQLTLPEPRREKLSNPEVYELLKGSTVVVASFFKCTECNEWHFESSSGFVVAEGVVSTCQHVVDYEDERMKEGWLVVADADSKVYAATEVLAANRDADTCLIRVPELTAKPLPLNLQARVGEAAFCLSHPDGYHWMFTSGMVSRFFINHEDPDTGEKLKPSLYLNVTTEYSPGSSGGPIVDDRGNVIAQVESITASLEEEDGDEKDRKVTTSYGMPIRSCVSAEEIAKLIRPSDPVAAKAPSPAAAPGVK